MKCAHLVSLAVFLAMPMRAHADLRPTVTVDRVFQNGSYIHVLMRIRNLDSSEISKVDVICDVFDHDGAALGRAEDVVDDIPGNETVVGEALASAPPGGSGPASAKCRVVH